ncbi:MAG: SDR family NAD(P)-dependent oxidoreductase [Gammaproteobacteria bacterium]|nr:SDR family NAD(P)-dependent oxidoreductase [Gammaproteobacteria bacterium]MDH5303628.1 SDR family NAD(P)-dependent oxidoreductase [Gammaproteobacteria bacterium]MDH5321084.1 SDR family NAD(P)-dependent oxidoreductase [Gammaproteobacteria bacterium]
MRIVKIVAAVALQGLLTFSLFTVAAADDVPQKAVLVTGASSGIGLRIAETLAENGYHVYAGARKAADLERLDAMQNVSAVRLDVTVQDDIDAAVDFVKGEGRGLWGIVNNAGVLMLGSLVTDSEPNVRTTLEINVLGPVRINNAFLPLLLESQGRTTTIGSISGYIAGSEDGGYSASKFAIEGYTDSLAAELAASGVHVSVVDPGGYKSEIRGKMLAQVLAAADAGEIELDAASREQMIRTNMGNDSLKEPDEVAQAVLHVMSSETPRRRYMVTPNAEQARLTISAAMQRLLELNADQPYSYDREQLIALLDELMAPPKSED